MVSLGGKGRVSLFVLVKPMIFLLTFMIALLVVFTAEQSTGATAIERNNERYSRVAQQVPGSDPRQNNQSFVGTSNSGNEVNFWGNNQGNSGNQGYNRGFSQDNGSNSGNMVSSQRKNIQYQENNQYNAGGGSNGNNITTMIGKNQGNSGNQGINQGYNQDNASNSGNQVNNQGNVIGTQINNQGTQVNNNGSIIGKQINHVTLIPPLHANLSLGSAFRFAVGAEVN
jgi:hypothetical protein